MIYRFQVRGRVYEVNIERASGGLRAWIDGRPYPLEVLDMQPGMISILFAGRPMTVHWADNGQQRWISMRGCTYVLEKPASGVHTDDGRSVESKLRSPMPAQVRSIEITPGDHVEKGQTLMLLEAMKMEIRLLAPRSGRVTAITVKPGQTVNRDQDLLEIE